ncbi:MAG: hypothetical protein V2I43_03600, partial [Parvularcula sp.]|nr:hypothetical protein [Parvularcula sp.]
ADRVRTSFLATTKMDRSVREDGRIDVLSSVRQLLRSRFGSSAQGEEGALRGIGGLSGRAGGPQTDQGAFPYARVLYAVPTVGRQAKDPSPIIKALADNRFSYRTETLESRDGAPMVFAIDVPQGRESRLAPVLRAFRRHPQAQALAVFPSVKPMVDGSVMARPSGMPKLGIVAKGAGVIAALLAGYVAYAMVAGQ